MRRLAQIRPPRLYAHHAERVCPAANRSRHSGGDVFRLCVAQIGAEFRFLCQAFRRMLRKFTVRDWSRCAEHRLLRQNGHSSRVPASAYQATSNASSEMARGALTCAAHFPRDSVPIGTKGSFRRLMTLRVIQPVSMSCRWAAAWATKVSTLRLLHRNRSPSADSSAELVGLAIYMPLACKSVPLAPRNVPLKSEHAPPAHVVHECGENRRSVCSDSRSDAVCRRHGEKPPAASQRALQVRSHRSCYFPVQQGSAQTGRHYPHRRVRPAICSHFNRWDWRARRRIRPVTAVR